MENTRIEIKKEITIATLERAIQKLQKELNKLKTIKDMEKQVREQQKIIDRLKEQIEPDIKPAQKYYPPKITYFKKPIKRIEIESGTSNYYGAGSPQSDTKPKDL